MKIKLLLALSLFWASLASAQTDSTAFQKRLCGLPGIHDVKTLESTCFSEKYVMKITQNVDGDTPAKGTFDQRIVVGFRGENRPTVLVTEGYWGDYALSKGYEEELCRMFDANLVFCEYRYFGESVPQPTNWDYMTVDNSLRDYHHVRQTLGEVFKGKWISTGISKGGQTTMFYRATYPNDVDVSVSYVAPLNRGLEDGRHEIFLAKKVGTKAERKAVVKAVQEMMKRKARLMPQFKKYGEDHHYTFLTDIEDIYDYCVLEYPFAIWQWGTPISSLPSVDADDQTWFDHLIEISAPEIFSVGNRYLPFLVQAARELGYYGYSLKDIKKWASLKDAKGYLPKLMLPNELRHYTFDASLYHRTVKFLEENDPQHIFIYGEIDPWSASGVCTWLDCSKKQNMRIYMQPRGSHRSRISNMPDDIKQEITERLSGWMAK